MPFVSLPRKHPWFVLSLKPETFVAAAKASFASFAMVVHRLFVLFSPNELVWQSHSLCSLFSLEMRSVAGLLNMISVPCVYSSLGHAQARDG